MGNQRVGLIFLPHCTAAAAFLLRLANFQYDWLMAYDVLVVLASAACVQRMGDIPLMKLIVPLRVIELEHGFILRAASAIRIESF